MPISGGMQALAARPAAARMVGRFSGAMMLGLAVLLVCKEAVSL